MHQNSPFWAQRSKRFSGEGKGTPLPTTHRPRCAFNFVSCGHRWTRNPRRHTCTRSSVAVLTTATACCTVCTVSATSCCRSYRSFRRRPHEWWRERCFANFTGSARSPTHKVQAGDDRLQVSPWVGATVSGWRLCTGLFCGRPADRDGTWDRRTAGSWSFGEHELLLAPEISRSPALSSQSETRYL